MLVRGLQELVAMRMAYTESYSTVHTVGLVLRSQARAAAKPANSAVLFESFSAPTYIGLAESRMTGPQTSARWSFVGSAIVKPQPAVAWPSLVAGVYEPSVESGESTVYFEKKGLLLLTKGVGLFFYVFGVVSWVVLGEPEVVVGDLRCPASTNTGDESLIPLCGHAQLSRQRLRLASAAL